MLEFWNKDCLRYGQVIKVREEQKVIGVYKKWIFGYGSYDKISIAHIDGYCSKLRERVSRFVREAKTFSKKRTMLKEMLDIMQAYNNLIEVKEKDKTPAMIERLVSCRWTWSRLLHKRLPFI